MVRITNRRPKTRGSVDNPSTRGIFVDVGLPDTTHENRAESPLYGELYPRYKPVPIINNDHTRSKLMATWAPASILTKYIPTKYILHGSRVNNSLLIQHILKLQHSNTCYTTTSKPQVGFLLKRPLMSAAFSIAPCTGNGDPSTG